MRLAAGLLFAALFAALLVVALPRPGLAAAAGVADCLVVPLVTTNEEMLVSLAEQDFTMVMLSGHVQELIAKSEISGLDG